jgi:ABC-type branched-subunit amino acid transport system substrate-binding protein
VNRLAVSVALAAAVTGGGVLTACSGTPAGDDLRIVVSAPVSTSPWIAEFARRGADLAAEQLNAEGGVEYGGRAHQVVVEVRDNAGSPQQVVADARAAVDRGAAALVIDGVGAAAVADVTDPASLPVFVVFDGGESFIDAGTNRTLFRMAPADRPMAIRLADYLAAAEPRIGLISDDTGFGRDGADAMREAFARDHIEIAKDLTVATTASDVSAQVLSARRAGATTLVVWAAAPVVADAIRAARSAGWDADIWAGPTGEDPLVRQQLADHVEWLDGVGFVSFRITAEMGPKPFGAYRAAYEKKYGVDWIGVKQDGRNVAQPPDWSMYSYDAVKLVSAALEKSGGVGEPLLRTLEGGVVITGANGDERGYLETTREGVSPDDMYFARFHGFVFAPVTDDLLSHNLPAVPQTPPGED